MESYNFLFFMAIIMISTKLFGLVSKKVNMPQVIGALVAGFILGPPVLNLVHETDFIIKSAEIGVIMLMFLAGLDTDLKELKKNGLASLIVALIGIMIPLMSGFLSYKLYFNINITDYSKLLESIFVGVVLTATSVSITVETLRELGKLKGAIGTTIMGAAIIDDIMGIIVLTIVTSLKDKSVSLFNISIKILLYFIFITILAVIIFFSSKWIENQNKKRRISILALAFCFILSYVSEIFFGIADITGAYFAGLLLCNLDIKHYIAKKITVPSYLIFSPIFFASIGIKTNLNELKSSFIYFAILLTLVAIFSKIIGCGLGAKICGFNLKESICIGIGMVSRGEVALIVAQKGQQMCLINDMAFSSIVIMVIVTTLITPIFLKVMFNGSGKFDENNMTNDQINKNAYSALNT